MKNNYQPFQIVIALLLLSTPAFANSDEAIEGIIVMLPAVLVGGGILFVAYLLTRIGLAGLGKIVGFIGAIIGGLALVGIVCWIAYIILSFVAALLSAAFTLAFYVGIFLLGCFIVYSIFNWLFSSKTR
ncbi:hypothetical protein JAO76_15620 [Pontibacter sp. BT310]|uniref:Uncharacterized protein n=1 Tax=Pontibacter populi TaxID=890055 RepID=A0ABS6XET9_9BACT|nr:MULTISPECIES: hypothetical protein [Pontibacter]MBJ6119639.1 hypothetical protein [Pontibacter sp. BT310]MBR0572066.1 hypothetical protein [Microvirga sp. STS03]MBW3366492.1 hypothetical protein [Pontibacter populi]